jgi:hypothetical protein
MEADFEIVPIPPADLTRLRDEGRTWIDGDGGSPLRCCLRDSEPGDVVVVASYGPPGGSGAYEERGPVFVHAAPCAGHGGGYPASFLDRSQVFRAYDDAGTIADAVLVEPGDHERALVRLFGDPAVVLVQSRNVLYGCFSFAIPRR